ncbi:MAG: LamG domain-containing protein, partial [Methanobacteriota archaeon]
MTSLHAGTLCHGSFRWKDPWRAGFARVTTDGERLAVRFPGSGPSITRAPYPLFAGRWYHLAASMKTWSTRTNLSLFVNGQLLAWKNETSYTVKSANNNALLYLGWDQATAGATFKGIVDEFRLYKRALGQNSTRGLLWFTGGSNSLLIPRGVFYDSKMYKGLNCSFDSNSPLKDAIVNGNSNTLSSNLNS